MTDELKPLDFSNCLKHAFLSGVTAARGIPAGDPIDGQALWVEYEPYEPGSYTRVVAAIDVMTHRANAQEAVRDLIEAATDLGLREIVAGWNGEGLERPYKPHPPHLSAQIKTTCGVVYRIDAALRAIAEKGGE